MSHTPTAEQAAIITAALTGANLVIEAGAGTGKTSTLKMLAAALGTKRGVYIAYNRSIADDAAKSFPSTVLCKTSHGLAYAAVGSRYRTRLNAGRQRAQDTARHLRITDPLWLDKDKAPLAPQQLARLVMATIGKFCYSADERITRAHVPHVNNYSTPAERAELARYLVPLAQRAWDTDITNTRGALPFTHDMYLKLWILSKPQLNADYVLLDEAQDSNPAVAALVESQKCQQILVGDRSQAIYGWRGATDAMAAFNGERYQLSQSFRFGPAVAAEANKWLTLLDAPLRLTGFDKIPSRVEELDTPDAILCRTNAGAVARVMEAIAAGRRAALVGGGKEIRRMAEAARDLQTVGHTDHPELFAFTSWREVQQYVKEDESAADLKVFVTLIDRYGAVEVMQVCDRMVDERYADLIVSTAHKAKGREWNRVLIDYDFTEPKPGDDGEVEIPRDVAMLAYVAVTRAQLVLDPGGLSWVNNHIGQPDTELEAPAAPAEEPATAPLAPATAADDDTLADEQDRWASLAAYVELNLPGEPLDREEPAEAPAAPAPAHAEESTTRCSSPNCDGGHPEGDLDDCGPWNHESSTAAAVRALLGQEPPAAPAPPTTGDWVWSLHHDPTDEPCPRCDNTRCTCPPAAKARYLARTQPTAA